MCFVLGACAIKAQANPAIGDAEASSASDKIQAQAISCIPLPPATAAVPGPMFESLPASRTGIDLVYRFPTNAPFELLQDQGCATGVAIGDYDGDGNADVFLTHYNLGCRLYRNHGHWRFENVTRNAGVEGAGRWCSGTTFVDIDNDGDLDLYVCVFNGPNLLYVNQGNGTFQEKAGVFGLDFSGASVMMAFADYDRDGRLDGYLVTHRLNAGTDHRLPANSQAAFRRSIVHSTGPGQVAVDPAYQDLFALVGKGQGRIELIIAGQQDYLYHQGADGRFTVVNEKAGIAGHDIGLAATWWDFDDDGYADLYVSNDYKGPDRLYRNNRDGTFTDVARSALPHVPWSSMGTDTSDLNNDGRLDLIATEMAGSTHFRRMMISADPVKERWFLTTSEPRQYQRNALYLGTGTPRVLEAACLAGLEATDWTWSPKLADLDNDGLRGCVYRQRHVAGFCERRSLGADARSGSRNWLALPPLLEANLAFRNLGDTAVCRAGKTWGLDASPPALARPWPISTGTATWIWSSAISTNRCRCIGTTVFRDTGMLVRLKGSHDNSWGIGAKVRVRTPSGIQARCLSLSSGILSANEPLAHFGLGSCSKIDELSVEWPSGERQVCSNLEADCFCTISEPAKPAPGDRLGSLQSAHVLVCSSPPGRPWATPRARLPMISSVSHFCRGNSPNWVRASPLETWMATVTRMSILAAQRVRPALSD